MTDQLQVNLFTYPVKTPKNQIKMFVALLKLLVKVRLIKTIIY